MVFSSLFFLYAFFPLSLLCYFLARGRTAKNITLLLFSLVFYTWGEPVYVLLLMGMVLIDWLAALGVEKSGTMKGRQLWLLFAVVMDLGLIGFFKYGKMITGLFGTPPAFFEKVALPIGISFYTFQLLSYVVDVYRGEVPAQKSYWNLLLYASLFHQCIAGPIIRYRDVARELFEHREVQRLDISDGICRFTLGLAKKAVLANACGVLTDTFLLTDKAVGDASLLTRNLAALQSTSVLGLWLGAVAFTFQIYLDFSAYSDMAIGMGKMLGLHYPENFNYPYLSRSATEFWRRWHISLGSFFRDYVYIPLGGSRAGKLRTVLNTFIVWALTGLWHGASWNFVLWGLYFFLLLTLERLILRKVFGQLKILPHLYLLLAVVVGWVLFHFTDARLALTALGGMFGLGGNPLTDFKSVTLLKSNAYLLAFCVLASTPLLSGLWKALDQRFRGWGGKGLIPELLLRGLIPAALLAVSTAMLVGNTYNPFLYFQF